MVSSFASAETEPWLELVRLAQFVDGKYYELGRSKLNTIKEKHNPNREIESCTANGILNSMEIHALCLGDPQFEEDTRGTLVPILKE